MFTTLINPRADRISVSVHSGSVLVTFTEPTGAELHLRFSTLADAAKFILGLGTKIEEAAHEE